MAKYLRFRAEDWQHDARPSRGSIGMCAGWLSYPIGAARFGASTHLMPWRTDQSEASRRAAGCCGATRTDAASAEH
jgi:hypothetical protein